MQSWASKKSGDQNVQMPYEKPTENDTMTTDYQRDDLPKPPKIDSLMLECQQIEMDLALGFKTSAIYGLYQP